ncbi:MAG: YHS domain-containing (seleno)protein [Saprospiraceae bacterium]
MKKTLLFFINLVLGFSVTAQSKHASPTFSTAEGAIRGYDPVAYFTDGRPVRGVAGITFDWNDATWHFASVAHRDSFQLNPEKYAPRYGGYCAYGWSKGYPAPINPAAWTIVDGKLYLNYSADVQVTWNKKQGSHIQAADRNWAKAHPDTGIPEKE